MINSLLAKLGWSRQLDVGLILFLAFYGTQLPLINKNTKKITGQISRHVDLMLGQ